jgi:glutathione S-transferase
MAAPLVLYHAAPSRSSTVHWLLEEIGQPYERIVLNLQKGEQLAPGYLALNPMGKVPTVKHGDTVITEVSAICCYLADAFPAAKLAPPIGDPRRGPYLKWLFYGPSCVEPAVMDHIRPRIEPAPRSMVGWADYATVLDVLSAAMAPGPYLLGEQFTAADVVIGAGLRWTMMFNLIPARPEYRAYVDRLEARPALQRATAIDQELMAANA